MVEVPKHPELELARVPLEQKCVKSPYKLPVWQERKYGAKSMRKIGHARASMSGQNFGRQIGALRDERYHEVYREKASAKATKGGRTGEGDRCARHA